MERTVTTSTHVEEIKRKVKAPDENTNRGADDFDAATQPASGAGMRQAAAGAALDAESRGNHANETEDALKRAAENDTRT